MNKQPEITEATKKRIIDAFWSLFKDLPVEKITAAMLSSEAGIHRSSFYRYFSDMYQVLDAFQTALLDDLKQETEAIQSSTAVSLPEYSDKTAGILLKYADKIYRMLNYKDSDFREHFEGNVKPNIEKTLNINPDNPNAEFLSSFIISVMLSNFNFWYEHKDHYELSQINAMGQQILLHGLSDLRE